MLLYSAKNARYICTCRHVLCLRVIIVMTDEVMGQLVCVCLEPRTCYDTLYVILCLLPNSPIGNIDSRVDYTIKRRCKEIIGLVFC